MASSEAGSARKRASSKLSLFRKLSPKKEEHGDKPGHKGKQQQQKSGGWLRRDQQQPEETKPEDEKVLAEKARRTAVRSKREEAAAARKAEEEAAAKAQEEAAKQRASEALSRGRTYKSASRNSIISSESASTTVSADTNATSSDGSALVLPDPSSRRRRGALFTTKDAANSPPVPVPVQFSYQEALQQLDALNSPRALVKEEFLDNEHEQKVTERARRASQSSLAGSEVFMHARVGSDREHEEEHGQQKGEGGTGEGEGNAHDGDSGADEKEAKQHEEDDDDDEEEEEEDAEERQSANKAAPFSIDILPPSLENRRRSFLQQLKDLPTGMRSRTQRVNSLSMKPMQAIRLHSRNRRLSSATGSKLFYKMGLGVGQVTPERLREINAQWLAHYGLGKDTADEEEDGAGNDDSGHAPNGEAHPTAAGEPANDVDRSIDSFLGIRLTRHERHHTWSESVGAVKEEEGGRDSGDRRPADAVPETKGHEETQEQLSSMAAASGEAKEDVGASAEAEADGIDLDDIEEQIRLAEERERKVGKAKQPPPQPQQQKQKREQQESVPLLDAPPGIAVDESSRQAAEKSRTVVNSEASNARGTPKKGKPRLLQQTAAAQARAQQTALARKKAAELRKTKKESPWQSTRSVQKSSARSTGPKSASGSSLRSSGKKRSSAKSTGQDTESSAKASRRRQKAQLDHKRERETPLVQIYSVDIRRVDPSIGRGLFATRDFEAGDVILVEKRLLGMQNADNNCLACAECMRFIGTLETQLQWLGGLSAPPSSLPEKPPGLVEYVPVPCKGGCNTFYCSNDCRIHAWMQCHQLLCTGNKVHGRALELFYKYADDTENERLHLGAKVIAMIIRRMRTKGMTIEQAFRPFAPFKKGLWWETIQPPDDLNLQEAAIFTQSLITMARTSLTLLKRALCTSQDVRPLFSFKFWGKILGMFEMNNWGTTSRNPLSIYFQHIKSLEASDPARFGKVQKTLGSKLMKLLEKAGEQLCEGTGLYLVGGCINHSCMPNACLAKSDDIMDDTTVVVAKQPVRKGEEILISYINETQRFAQRREALSFYGFECKCPRCLKDSLNLTLVKPKVVIYTSETSGNRQMKTDQSALEHLFHAHKVEFEVCDVSKPEFEGEKGKIKDGDGRSPLPQVFVNGVYRGGLAQFHAANEMDGGFHRFLYYGPLRRLTFYNPKFFALHNQESDLHKSDLSLEDLEGSSDEDYDDLADYEGDEREALERQDPSTL